MNILLIFFALPIATIIISIALQKILKCPILVAAIIFAIFLVVTFIVGNLNFLVAAIIYAIISFITAVLTHIICRILNTYRDRDNNCWRDRDNCNCNRNNTRNDLLTISSSCQNNRNGDLLTISSNGCNGNTNDLLTISSNNNRNNNCCNNRNNNCNNNCNNSCDCNCCSDDSNNTVNFANGVSARINVIPNGNNNGETGCISGCYRRRR